ncbi:MAG: hypothetical protein GEU93_18070 [Propionibacteriales bacterium]|nr:hypothetical protein [Propionibacteriales bacterium]
MVSDLERQQEYLQQVGHHLLGLLAEYGIGQAPLRQLIEIGAWVEHELPMLRRRLELARTLESAQPGFHGIVHISEPAGMPTAAQRHAVRGLADRLLARDLADTSESAVDADLLHRVAEDLAQYSWDPVLMADFYARLGHDATVRLPEELEWVNGQSGADDLAIFSRALGAAADALDPPSGFTRLFDSFDDVPDGEHTSSYAWNRLALLQSGDFDAGWLRRVVRANALDGFTEDPDSRFPDQYDSGTDTGRPQATYQRTVALAFGALANNPSAARETLLAISGMDSKQPDVDDGVERLQSLVSTVYDAGEIDHRYDQWGGEIPEAFGRAVEAATGTGFDEPGHHGAPASRFAYQFIRAAGQLERVPFSIKASLARIAGSYSPEMLTGARVDDAARRESSQTVPAAFSSIDGLEPRFYLSLADTYQFLHGFADDDEVSQPFNDGVRRLWDRLTFHTARADYSVIRRGEQDPAHLDRALGAFGNLAGLQYLSQVHVRGRMDEADARTRSIVQHLGLLPMFFVPGGDLVRRVLPLSQTGAGAVWSALQYGGRAGIDRATAVDATRVDDIEATMFRLSVAARYDVARALMDAGYGDLRLRDTPFTDDDGDLLRTDQFLADSQTAGRAREEFDAWLDQQDLAIGGSETAHGVSIGTKVKDGTDSLLVAIPKAQGELACDGLIRDWIPEQLTQVSSNAKVGCD